MRKPAEFQRIDSGLLDIHNRIQREGRRYGPFIVAVKHWVDGDTLYAKADPGWNDYPWRVIRLKDIDAPEINRKESRERGMAVLNFVQSLAPVDTLIVVDTDKDPLTFGRYVAYCYLADGREIGQEIKRFMEENGILALDEDEGDMTHEISGGYHDS